jgi:hypothetical protein
VIFVRILSDWSVDSVEQCSSIFQLPSTFGLYSQNQNTNEMYVSNSPFFMLSFYVLLSTGDAATSQIFKSGHGTGCGSGDG